MNGSLRIEVTLRRKNQLTLPEAVAQRLGVAPGDRLVIELEGAEGAAGDRAVVRAVRRSYAGALAGVYGTPGEAADYLQEERASWEE